MEVRAGTRMCAIKPLNFAPLRIVVSVASGTSCMMLAVVTCPGMLWPRESEVFNLTGSRVPEGIWFSDASGSYVLRDCCCPTGLCCADACPRTSINVSGRLNKQVSQMFLMVRSSLKFNWPCHLALSLWLEAQTSDWHANPGMELSPKNR